MDIHFIGPRTPTKAIALILGNHSLFDPQHCLTIRIGGEKTVISFGTSPASDVRISTHGMVNDLAIVLNKKLQNAVVKVVKSTRRIIVAPNKQSFVKAEYPVASAILTEEIELQQKEPFGDIKLENGDFQIADSINTVSQDLIARIISSRSSKTGFKFAAEYGSGWDSFIGSPRTKETINKIEQAMLIALTKDKRYPVTAVKLFPIGENGLQPVIYFGPRVLNLPLEISTRDGIVIQK